MRCGSMGSVVYARACRKQNLNIVAVVALETMGYYSDKPDSQRYPPLLSLVYPSTGAWPAPWATWCGCRRKRPSALSGLDFGIECHWLCQCK